MIIHVIKPGESLWALSVKYGVSIKNLMSANQIRDPSLLIPGQSIVIPGIPKTHIVQVGESLWSIAKKYNSSVNAIIKANNIQNPAQIYPGQSLIIPASAHRFGIIETNAYVEPSIANDRSSIVKQTAPYLTYISVFSYQVKFNGTLSSVNDDNLIATAIENKVAPMMVITNFSNGTFNTQLAHTILTNDEISNKFMNEAISTAKSKKYYGINIDFERISPEDKDAYNNFLIKFKKLLSSENLILSTALAPKYSSEQTGPWYTAHDYSAHGKIADYSVLMTYEWGWSGGPPLPVAPLNQVKRVLDYAISVMPRNKIMMGIPLYGYDWTLPYVRGGDFAKVVSPNEAVEIAQKNLTIIQYDNIAQSPYFNYFDSNSKEHIVWFEDARSIKAKYELAGMMKLRGVSYWVLSKPFPQNWIVLEDLFEIKKLYK